MRIVADLMPASSPGLSSILDLKAPPLRPAGVHAQQHFRPILRFRSAGTGMHLR